MAEHDTSDFPAMAEHDTWEPSASVREYDTWEPISCGSARLVRTYPLLLSMTRENLPAVATQTRKNLPAVAKLDTWEPTSCDWELHVRTYQLGWAYHERAFPLRQSMIPEKLFTAAEHDPCSPYLIGRLFAVPCLWNVVVCSRIMFLVFCY